MKSKVIKIFRISIIVICLIIFIWSLFNIIRIKFYEVKEKNQFTELREKVKTKKVDNVKKDKTKVKSISKYDALYNENKDFVAWLKIEDSVIDYPVMSTPKDINYYLRRGFNKKYSFSGTPFIGDGLTPNDKSFIIYSHNMKNGSMFGGLEKYRDNEYKNNHKYIKLDTLEESRTYEVMGAFSTEINENDERFFKYYNYVGDLDKEKFDDFITRLSKISIYGDVKNIKYEDQILMLSTCSYFADDGRFIVVAKRVDNK